MKYLIQNKMLQNCKVHKGNSKYRGEMFLCDYFNDYWIDLRSDETFVQCMLMTPYVI